MNNQIRPETQQWFQEVEMQFCGYRLRVGRVWDSKRVSKTKSPLTRRLWHEGAVEPVYLPQVVQRRISDRSSLYRAAQSPNQHQCGFSVTL